MKGLSIFFHSVRLVFNNIDAALRISLVLFAVYAVLQFWLSTTWAPVSAELADVGPGQVPPGALFSGLLMLVISLWIAVAWHRYVLLGEMPAGWVPVMRGGLMLGYFGRSILLALIVIIAAAVMSTVSAVVLVLLGPMVAVGGSMVLTMATAFYLFYRLCAILPGGAVGKPVTLGEAWAATRGTGGTILSLVILSVLALLIVQIPTMLSGDPNSTVSVVYGIVIGWPVMLVGSSILTTFYGHFIEGRTID